MVVHALVGFSMVYFAQDGCPFSDRATQNIYFLLFPVQLFLFLCFIKVGLLMNQFIRRLAARRPLNIQPGPLNHTHTHTHHTLLVEINTESLLQQCKVPLF